MNTLLQSLALASLATTLWAGPPLICERIDIGDARSLPWTSSQGWNGADPRYDRGTLAEDTLALLAPGTSVLVRRETLRRAAIYSSSDERISAQLTARLQARVLDSEAAGKPDAMAWFDAGYFVETLRQATFIYKYDMLSPREREAWKLRGESPRIDGYQWVQRAIRMGARGLQPAVAAMEEYRRADLRPVAH